MAQQHWFEGRYAAASSTFRELVAREPGNADAWQGLAIAAESLGQMTDALAASARAVELAPDAVEFRVQYAGQLQRQGDLAAAAVQWREAMALRPHDAFCA